MPHFCGLLSVIMAALPSVLRAALLCAAVVAAAAMPIRDSEVQNSTVRWPSNYYGVDISDYVSEADFACLRAQNLQYAIVRCYQVCAQAACVLARNTYTHIYVET